MEGPSLPKFNKSKAKEKVLIEKLEKSQEIPEAPEGWKTKTALSADLGVAYATFAKIADKYRESHPEYFQEFKTGRGHVFEHYAPELVKIIKEEIEKFPEAPEGWRTKTTLSVEIEISHYSIAKIADQYRESNPEYFQEFRGSQGKVFEHYSPSLVKIISREVKEFKKLEAPEGWKTKTALSADLGVAYATFAKIADKYRESNPEYFGQFKDKKGKVREHYSPELIKIITEEIRKLKEIPEAPEGWKTNRALYLELKSTRDTIQKIADKYRESDPEYFGQFKDKVGHVREHYSPELIKIITEVFTKWEAPEGWKTKTVLSADLGVDYSTFVKIADKYRESNPEYFGQFKDKKGKVREHYSPELIKIITEEIRKFKEIPEVPEGWKTNAALSTEIGISRYLIAQIADKYRESNPEYFGQYKEEKGAVFEYYAPELVEIIKEGVEKYEKAPEGWMTNRSLTKELKSDKRTTKSIANQYRESNPEYFGQFKDKMGRVREHYSPELVEIIKEELKEKIKKLKEMKEKKEQEERLRADFEDFAKEIADKETSSEKAKKIREIIELLPGNAHDIILRHHPEYKGMSVGYVKSIIAEYLGDFLVVKKEWQPDDIEKVKDLMEVKEIKELILLNFKNSCLAFVNKERKNNPLADESDLVEKYFQKPKMIKAASSGIEEVEKTIKDLRSYFRDIFILKENKPSNIVDKLKEGRIFPDINQLLNIKEIEEKKKMLIADEMGLGKSASAILAKEYLGLRNALIIMPSNVEDTWKNFLSDQVDEQGKQVGYFKKGLAPKVLIINSKKDLERLRKESFDYVLISQEKIPFKYYEKALGEVDFDMMIVDEVHKLKNIKKGARSEAVVRLAEKIQGENKYLALLSGTPIPNKVKDVAISLKLLYPEKYKNISNKEMVIQIIYSDLIDLRTELLMRMQMKELQASIEIPPLKEVDIEIDLSPEEREIYEILLEEDELDAPQKITLFRQFLLNPALLNIEPGFIGSKIEKLEETLKKDLQTQDKIVVFVNSYIEGVIRGDLNIIDKMDLPKDVVIEEIHGEIDKAERKRIESELKSANKKMVVFVSGMTSDVGVDFSGAEGVIFYNEPWSKYEKKQQQARVYREGLKKPLVSKTLITKNSIEGGIRNYINAKEKAIEKLLRGIPRTEAEKKLLYNDSEKLIRGSDIETNAKLSREYLSDWGKLMIHFGHSLFAGEKKLLQQLPETGKEYAKLYSKLGRLTYQGNNARVTSTLIEGMIKEKKQAPERLRVIDMASGPEMLKEAASDKLKERIFSLDINPEHFATSEESRKTLITSYLDVPSRNNSVDYYNIGFAFHQTSPIKYYKKNYERLQVLAEMNRVLKPGGRAIISMLHDVKFTNQDKFSELINKLGFKLIPSYSGEASGGENYKADFYTLEKVDDISEYKDIVFQSTRAEKEKKIMELADKIGREFLEGLQMKKLKKGKSRLKDQRRMIEKVKIGGREISLILNDIDKELLSKEKQAIKDGEALKSEYGGIANIPLDKIKSIGFERKLETPGYFLLYKIIETGGAVIIRGDYKSKKKKKV